MKFFKSKIDFDTFLFQAFQKIFAVYEDNKEAVLDKVQWENNYKMTTHERDKLWELFTYLIPIGLLSHSIIYFKGKYSTQELAERISQNFFIFLNKEKNYSLEKLEIFQKAFFKFVESHEKKAVNLEEGGHSDIITNTGTAFAEIFCQPKVEKSHSLDPLKTRESQMNFAALKLSKSYLAKGGLLEKLFSEFKIVYS